VGRGELRVASRGDEETTNEREWDSCSFVGFVATSSSKLAMRTSTIG
jgi:hypothetical protein